MKPLIKLHLDLSICLPKLKHFVNTITIRHPKKYTENKVKLLENKLKHQKLSSDCPNKLAKLTMQGAAKVSLCDATKEVLSLADVKVMSKVQCCDVYTGKQHVLHSICSSRGNTQITYTDMSFRPQ